MRWFLLDLAVFVAILLVALARLPDPLFGDQALNMLMGQVIADGGSPYADLWDLKYPGIFFFFAAGGALFGFNEIGVHLFELLWMLSLGILVRVTAGRYLRCRACASLAPALTVGTYYALTTSYHLTQTEAVIGLPLLLSLLATVKAAHRDCQRPRMWLLISGVCAGMVFVFKAPYVVLPVLFWVLPSLMTRWQIHDTASAVRVTAPPLLVGVMLPVLLTSAYLAFKPGFSIMWWTFVVHPREAASQGGVFAQRFVDSVVWFVRTFRVPLILAVVGTWSRWRRGWDLLTVGLLTWVVVGTLVIWIQVISWWPYHYLALFVPVGLLAVCGLEALWFRVSAAATSGWHRAFAIAVLCLCGVLYDRQVRPLSGLVTSVFRRSPLPFDTVSMWAFNSARSQPYAEALATTAFLREPESQPGPVFVFGDPNLYHFAGRRPAISLLFWGTSPPAGAWPRLISELQQSAPPYIFVSHRAPTFVVDFDGTVATHLSAIQSTLKQRYRPYRKDAVGTWYIRGDLAPDAK